MHVLEVTAHLVRHQNSSLDVLYSSARMMRTAWSVSMWKCRNELVAAAGIPAATLTILLKIRDRLQEPRTTATCGFLYHQFKCGFRICLSIFASRQSAPQKQPRTTASCGTMYHHFI